MEAIYPFSALKTNQREVKDAALEGVVHVTENGRGHLCSAPKTSSTESFKRLRKRPCMPKESRLPLGRGARISKKDAASKG